MEFNWIAIIAAVWLAAGWVKYRIYFRAMMQFFYIMNEINPAAYRKRFNIFPEWDTFQDARFYRPLVLILTVAALPVLLVTERAAFFQEVDFDKMFHHIRRKYGNERAGDGRGSDS